LKSYELVEVQLDQGAAKEGDANRSLGFEESGMALQWSAMADRVD
jgi:hypothetical protein